jgi:hypothetical protein
MQFTADIDYKKLSLAFQKIPLIAAKELRSELNQQLRTIQVNARLHHNFKTHSGQLERSIQEDVEGSGLSGKVWLEESVAPYGKFVHDGTKEHQVAPKSRKALYFVSGGQKWFSKGHMVQGIKKDQFLFKAFDRQKPYFLARIRDAVKRIFDAVGL